MIERKWTISEHPAKSYYGVIEYCGQEIGINSKVDKLRQRSALFHELLHSIIGPLDATKDRVSHDLIRTAATFLAGLKFQVEKAKRKYGMPVTIHVTPEIIKVRKWTDNGGEKINSPEKLARCMIKLWAKFNHMKLTGDEINEVARIAFLPGPPFPKDVLTRGSWKLEE